MTKIDVYLGLGSNVGDRELALMRAMTALDQVFGTAPERISRIVETPAWGFEGPDFLNLCVLYRIPAEGTPQEQATALLRQIKAVEKSLGREEELLFDADGRRIYQDRPIDIDILLFGKEQVRTAELTIPHPLIGERDFVKKPLKEIAKPDIKTAFPDFFVSAAL